MELEAKFAVPDPDLFQNLRQRTQLGPFLMHHAAHPELQHNFYFDTADFRLRAARQGLRIRQLDNNRMILTLKANAQESDGIYQRDEWEVDVTSADPSTWPAAIMERVRAVTGDTALHQVLTIMTNRMHSYAEHRQMRVLELSMDQGEIHAAGKRETICELEIEVLGNGTRTDLDLFLQHLREHYQLMPEHRSKLERGMLLLHAAAEE